MSKFYLFDFDGTLVDSMPSYVSCMLRILDENQIRYPDNIVKIITPLGTTGTARYFIEQLGLKMSTEQLWALMREYLCDAYYHTIPLKPNVLQVLKALKSRGASLNILTAGPHITLDPCAKRLGLWELFDSVWSCDDFHTTKTDPEIYRMVAAKLGTTAENVLFLDDNLDADKAAKAAGMQVCGVYDESSAAYAEEMKSVADYYVYDMKELLNLS